MSSDLSDLPPFAEEIRERLEEAEYVDGVARSGVDVVSDVFGDVFDVTLPPKPGSKEAKLSKMAEPLRIKRDVFDAAVNAAWVLWLRGEPVTVGDIERVAGAAFEDVDLELLSTVLASEKFRLAMASRGVEFGRLDVDGLSAEMVATVRVLSDPEPGLTVRERLKSIGVSWDQFQGWLNFGPFRSALTASSERSLRGAVALANTRLVEQVDSGDLRSVKYLHELTGYFTPGRQQVLDTQQLVRDVMTVVLRRVTDPDLLMQLAGDFRMLQERMTSVGGSGEGERGATVPGFGMSDAMVDVAVDDIIEGEVA